MPINQRSYYLKNRFIFGNFLRQFMTLFEMNFGGVVYCVCWLIRERIDRS